MPSPIRVCHLGKYYPPAPGGIETYVRTMALAQAGLGLDVSVFCMNHDSGPGRVDRDGPVRVHRFARRVSVAKLDVCPDLASALRSAPADVIHLHVPNPTMILAILASGVRTPVVVTYHSDVVKQRLRAALFDPLERLAYRRVRAILPTSPPYIGGSRFLRRYADRLHVVPIGIDLGPYLERPAERLAEAERIRAEYPGPIWVGCGRQIYYKGFLNAIRALARVPGTLLLVGDGPDGPLLRAEARRLGLERRVAFLGRLPHVHDIIPYYLAAEALWFPSNARSEAFGIVQVEAMACGCPVINAEIPHSGVPWVSRHDREGLTVAVDDPVALADAANRLLSEPGLRARLATAARERAASEFDHRTMAGRSLDVYRRILARAPEASPSAAGAGLPDLGRVVPS